MYTSVSSSPSNDELAFTNYTSPISVVLTNYNGQFIELKGKKVEDQTKYKVHGILDSMKIMTL